jgi:hypothetical protein
MLELPKGYVQKDFLDHDCTSEGIHHQCVYELTATGPGMKPMRSYLILDKQSNLYLVDKFDYTRKKYFGKYYVNKYGDLAIQVKSKKRKDFSPILYLKINKYSGLNRYSFSGNMGKTYFSLNKATPPHDFIQKKKRELLEMEKLRDKKLERERLRKERLRQKKYEEKRKEMIRKNPCGLTMSGYAKAKAKCQLDAEMYGTNYSVCYRNEIRKILKRQGCR